MSRLPDGTSLGERPVPRSERAIATYRPDETGKALQEAGKDLGAVADGMNERHDRLESAYAESALLKGQIETLAELDKDQDYTTYEQRFTERMNQVKQDAAGRIRDSSQRALFEAQADTSIARGMSQVKDLAKSKEADYGQASLLETIEQNRNAALGAPDEATASRLLWATNDAIVGARNRGYISAESAAQQRIKFLQDYAANRAEMLSPRERIAALKSTTSQDSSGGFDSAIGTVFQNEGGFTAVDGASGAPAIYGINRKWHERAFDEAKRITDTQGEEAGKAYAQDFYKREFWDKRRIGELDPAVQTVVLDGVINHTTAFGTKLVNAARNGASPDELVAMRDGEYERLAKAAPEKYGQSLDGWKARLGNLSPAAGKKDNWSDFLPPDTRYRMLEKAKGEMRSEVEKGVSEIDAVARLGLTVPHEKIEALATEASEYGLDDTASSLRQFANVQDAASAFAMQSLTDQESQLKTLKAEIEGGKLGEAPKYGAMQKVFETKVAMLKDEPWAYYQAHGLVQEHPAIDFANPQAVAAQVAARRSDAEAVRAVEGGRFNLPLLRKDEIDSLKTAYETAEPQQAASMIAGVGQSLNGPERQTLARAVAPKSQMLAVALSVEPDKALKLISGSRVKGEVSDAKVREAANQALAGVAFDPDANEAMHGAVYAYYKQLALEKGDVSKEVNTDLMEKAITDVVGPRAEFSLRMLGPTSKVLSFRDDSGQWADEDRLVDILTGITDDVLTSVNGSLPYASDGQPVKADEIKRRAQFVTAGDGQYVAVYPGLGVVATRNGSPYLFDARKLEAAQRGAE